MTRRALGAVAALACVMGAHAGPPVPDRCAEPTAETASPDLYCVELIAAPGLSNISGHVLLDFVPGPFTVSVTRDGQQRYRPRFTVRGLPSPRTLDSSATVYVAWATTPRFAEFVNLGTVGNGTTTLAPIDFDQFVIVISAERSAAATDRTGRLVLRGGSPSTRLQPPDFQQFALAIANVDSVSSAHQHDASAASPGSSDARWTSVPMPAGIGMLSSEMALRPPATPWLPNGNGDIPMSRRSSVMQLADGDTLNLIAGRIRRRIHGREYVMYAFNGQTPGPLLVVEHGARITVRFRNELEQPTTVHWHGVRLDWRMDGVPHVSQEPVAPGAEFTYTVRFPDAGMYWYHPHVREDAQQDLGLAGNIMVGGDGGPRREVLMVDDVLIGDDGLVPFGREHATHALMGRFGNVFLTNGEPRWTGGARSGETVRYWFTNASNARTFNLSFTNATMKLIASDLGAFERSVPIDNLVLAPAERYAVDVTFGGRAVALENRVRALDHVFGRFVQQVDTLGVVMVSGEPAAAPARVESPVASLPRVDIAGTPDLVLGFGVRTEQLPYVTSRMMLLDSSYFHPVEWSGTMVGMNWATTTAQAHWFVRDLRTGRENEDIGLAVRQGDRRRLRLVNQRNSLHAMHHPIHLHGQRFLVISVNGVAPTARAWKDTVLLPAGAVADILVEFDNPGQWMLHCHIAEHVESGMMTTFTVERR